MNSWKRIRRYPSTLFGLTIVLFFLLMAVYFTQKSNLRYELHNRLLYLLLGIFLGTIAVFLGIGGGPINVPVFMILFSLPAKQATAYSIVVIFFSHLSRIITMGLTGESIGYMEFDLSFLPFIVPAAIIGGAIGAVISRKLSDNAVKRAFSVTMWGLVIINIYNLANFIIYFDYLP